MILNNQNKKYLMCGKIKSIIIWVVIFKQKIFDAWKIKDHIIYIPMIKSTYKEYHYKFKYYIDNIEELKKYI